VFLWGGCSSDICLSSLTMSKLANTPSVSNYRSFWLF
jgi:hypothetical protein